MHRCNRYHPTIVREELPIVSLTASSKSTSWTFQSEAIMKTHAQKTTEVSRKKVGLFQLYFLHRFESAYSLNGGFRHIWGNVLAVLWKLVTGQSPDLFYQWCKFTSLVFFSASSRTEVTLFQPIVYNNIFAFFKEFEHIHWFLFHNNLG